MQNGMEADDCNSASQEDEHNADSGEECKMVQRTLHLIFFSFLRLLDIGQPDATSRIYSSCLSVSLFDEQKP